MVESYSMVMCSGGAAIALGLIRYGGLKLHGSTGGSNTPGVQAIAGEGYPEEKDIEDEGEGAACREDTGGEGASGTSCGTCT